MFVFLLILSKLFPLLINILYFCKETDIEREAPWSSGEHRGLTIPAILLGRGFESRHHLKTKWKDHSLGENITKKERQLNGASQKNIFKN